MPTSPVVAKKVGNIPTPESKMVFQYGVLLILAGRCIAQASPNLFGPKPRIGSLVKLDLATRAVDEKEGRTSVFGSLR